MQFVQQADGEKLSERMAPHEVGSLAYEIDRLARRMGMRFELDERKLQAMGYDSKDCDEIFCVFEFPRLGYAVTRA